MSNTPKGLPLLGANIPTSIDEINRLPDTQRLLRGELQRAYALYCVAKDRTEIEFRTHICRLFTLAFGRSVKPHHIREALGGVREAYKNLIDRVPLGIRHNLESDGHVRITEDLREILIAWFEPDQHGGINTASIEARTHWVLFSIALEAIMTPRTSPEGVTRKMAGIMSLLNGKFFATDGDEQPKYADIWYDVHTQDGVVKACGIGESTSNSTDSLGGRRTQKRQLIRYIKVDSEYIPVLLQQTNKSLPSLILKVIAKGTRKLDEVDDLYRFKLVALRKGDEVKIRKHLRDTIATLPGFVCDFKSLHKGTQKYHFPILGVQVEIMIMSLHDYLEEQTAHDRTNHAVYKGGNYLDSVYERLFPFGIYGVDWSDQIIREAVVENYRDRPL